MTHLDSFCEILVADDDEDDIEMLCAEIRRHLPAANIHVVNDGAACIRFLKTSPPPQLIFLDINMPRITGLGCMEWICKHETLKQIPVVVFSTSRYYKEVEACYNHGALYYVVKPSSRKGLSRLFDQLFSTVFSEAREKRTKQSFLLIDD